MKKIFLTNFLTREDAGFGIELQNELIHRGIETEKADVTEYLMDLGNGSTVKPNVIKEGGIVTPVRDSLFFMKKRKPESSLETRRYSSTFLQFVQSLGAGFLNPDFAQHDKLVEKPSQYIKLISHGYRIPRTLLVHGSRIERFRSYIESVLTYPFVLKATGSCGRYVWKIHTFDDIEKNLHTVRSKFRKETLVVQEFIEDSHEEFRALFFLGELVAVIVRSSPSFLNNHAQGGTVTPGVLTKDEIDLARAAALFSGLDYVGVDFMRDASGNPIFIELQTGPSLTVTKMVNPKVVEDMANILHKRATS